MSYYEIWIAGLEKLTLAAGMIDAKELEQGRALAPGEVRRASPGGRRCRRCARDRFAL